MTHWAELGAEGWHWEGVLPFFRRLENDRDFDGPLHGKAGPIRLQRYPREVWPRFTQAVIESIEAEGWSNIRRPEWRLHRWLLSGRLQSH